MGYCFPPFTNCFNIPTCFQPCLPSSSYTRSCTISGVSKLANFAHYGNCEKVEDCLPAYESCGRQHVAKRRLTGESGCTRNKKCPPLPPCQPNCIPNCKDLPAQRLRNVDILEELCYYVPGGDDNGPMDCYTVDCCGNVEKIGDDDGCGCCGGGDEDSGGGLQPVKYSRRQRFSFNDKNPERECVSDPWPFNECEDHCCGGKGKGHPHEKSKCGRNGNIHGGEAHSGGRKYTYCPEETIDCKNALPPKSGVYYWDKERRAFVPEENLPKANDPIEKTLNSEVEEYELMAEERQMAPQQCPPPQVQPVIQPIIMPTGGSSCQTPQCGPCSMPPYPQCPPPPCYPPQPPPPCYPPPCNQPPPCYPPPCNPCQPQYNPCQAQCNPCQAPCNPCNSGCNPCNPCNRPCNPCNPCHNQCNVPPACNPCNPCAPCNPCNPCAPCNPCMPCGPMNPFMNMCGGVLPMVIPMCPQQPGGMGGMGPPPPPPFPFPHNFMNKMGKGKNKSKKSKSSKSKTQSSSYSSSSDPTEYESYTTSHSSPAKTDNIVVLGAPEAVIKERGEDVPPEAYPVVMDESIDISGMPEPLPDPEYPAEAEPMPYYDANFNQPQEAEEGTFVTTFDFPPGEAEHVRLIGTNRKNPNKPNIDVLAQFQGGRGDIPPRGMDVSHYHHKQHSDGATTTSYQFPHGQDGYIHAKRYDEP